jgi:AcrR family transcriptional regulator
MSEAEPGPGTLRKRRLRSEIMARLVSAAEEEFKTRGYSGGTTAAIARRAEITEAQLFRYFPSKAALFRQAIVKPLDDHFQSFLLRRNGARVEPQRFGDEARAYISELQDFIRGHEKMFLSLVAAEAYAQPNIAGVMGVDSLQEYFAHGATTLATHGVEAPVDPKLMVRVSFAAVLACVIFRDWLFPDDLADDPALREAVNHFVLFGIQGQPPSDTHPAVEGRIDPPGKPVVDSRLDEG